MKRQTRQRQAIRDVIRAVDRPLAPQEVLAEAGRHVRGLGIATVYRTINALVEEGEVTRVEIPGQPTRYEKAGLDHHHHFCCDGCGKVYELDGCALRSTVPTPEGFTVARHEITLYGQCLQCRSA